MLTGIPSFKVTVCNKCEQEISYYSDLSEVVINGRQQTPPVEKRGRGTPRGYGDDTGGGNTAGMLQELKDEYGTVTSFAGTYHADYWDWNLPLGNEGTVATKKLDLSSLPTTQGYEEVGRECLSDCSCGHVYIYGVDVQCINGYCECNSQIYNRVTCLPSVGSCNIRLNDFARLHATPNYRQSDRHSVYSCIGNQGISVDVHALGVYEGSSDTDSAGTIDVTIRTSTSRPVILVLSSYTSVNWTLNVPYTLNIVKVILIYYECDVNEVVINGIQETPPIEKRGRRTPHGYGDDTGGGNTAGMLQELIDEYGTVTSFAGTYHADNWDWNLPLGNEVTAATQITEHPTAHVKTSTTAQVCMESTLLKPQLNMLIIGFTTGGVLLFLLAVVVALARGIHKRAATSSSVMSKEVKKTTVNGLPVVQTIAGGNTKKSGIEQQGPYYVLPLYY